MINPFNVCARLSSFDRTWLLVLSAAVSVPGTAAMVQAEPALSGPVVQVIDPMTVSPLLSVPPWIAKGPAEHRRVVTHDGNGSVNLDIGYNTYKQGVRLSTPYAYITDEFCYIPSGRVRMEGEGALIEVGTGDMMWRPAGGVTTSAEFLEDTVTICAMAPARLDANSHRVPAQDVGKWKGDPKKKPYPHWFKVSEAPVITGMDKSAGNGVEERELVSRRKDGSAKASVVYIKLKTGAHLVTGLEGEQICWLESGTLRLSAGGEIKAVATRSFIYRPQGAKIERLQATSDGSMICISGPAAL